MQDEENEIPQTLSNQSPLETILENTRLSSFFPWDACGTPTVKIRFGCTQNCKASQQDCVKSLSIISSSKSTNQIVQNLYRFLIDLLPLKNVDIRTFLAGQCKTQTGDCRLQTADQG